METLKGRSNPYTKGKQPKPLQ